MIPMIPLYKCFIIIHLYFEKKTAAVSSFGDDTPFESKNLIYFINIIVS